MNNNYENSNYLCNYYDNNYCNSYNQTNDRRFDSLQYSNGWVGNWSWPQSGHSSYYEPNYSYNGFEPMNGYHSLAPEEVESYPHQFAYSDIQSHNYLDKTDKTFDNAFKNSDNLIPVTVEEVEKQIKSERGFDELISEESQNQQMNCLQISQETLQTDGHSSEQKENENECVLEIDFISRPSRRRKNRKQMTYEELKREKRESNRLAATKCRQKKLYQLEALEKRSKLLVDENDKLEQRLNEMKAQVFDSKLALIYHRNSGCLLNAFRN